MEDEFESSARLLPPAEVKQIDSKLAAESQPAESQRENKVSAMLLLPAAVEKQVESMPVAASEPAGSQEENQVFQMQLLFAPEEKQADATLAAVSEPADSEEKNTLSEMRLWPVVEEKQAEIEPVAETTPAESQEANKVPETQPILVAEEKQADTKPAVVSKSVQSKAVDRKAFERPFRVKLRGSVLVLVRLPNKRSVRAAIHQLSTSGGVIHFEKPLDEKLEVELIFNLQKATIRGKAQMLFPMWATLGWMQPFRFVDLTESSRGVLDEKLKAFLGEAKGAAAGA
jgi:hypothetical protein